MDSKDKLLFILFYFRHYPTQAVQGFLFGIGQALANVWVHRLTGMLNQALGYEQQLPERQPHKLEQVLATCPELEFVMDGTERRINRPKDKEKRDQHYSGKKTTTTVKNHVMTERCKGGKVKYLSQTVEGKRHDQKPSPHHGPHPPAANTPPPPGMAARKSLDDAEKSPRHQALNTPQMPYYIAQSPAQQPL